MIRSINPPGWARPKGYSNGMLARGLQQLLFVAGQIAWDPEQQLVGRDDFGVQFRQALANVCAVVEAAGGKSNEIVDMTIYVTDKRRYLAEIQAVGAAWRDLMGRHYPAMALVEVADLLEEGAMVEIKAIASIEKELR